MPGDPIDSEDFGEERSGEPRPPGEDGEPTDGDQELDALQRQLLDAELMLRIFRRELPAASGETLKVLTCSVKPAKTVRSRKAIRDRRSEFVYRLRIALASGTEREVVLLGLAPVADGFPGPELEQRCRELRDHPLVAPFRRLALRLEALPLGLLVFPLDPRLPALAEVTGPDLARLLAPHLPECRAGARLAHCSHELRHYKPGERAVLRVRAEFGAESGAPVRHVYVKLFSDQQGAASHADLCALFAAARGSRWLRVPEPLGYDGERRMLVLAEVGGGRALADWIHCLEHGQPLPRGVDLSRVESGVLAAARAIAALQHCGVQPPSRRAFSDVLASLEKDRKLLAREDPEAQPELLRLALDLVGRLKAAAPREELLVPSHGGARHKQTVGDEQGLTFIDWDGFCLASPALDAATFLARLRLAPITEPDHAPVLERLAERFRTELLEQSPEAASHLALYEGLVLTEQVLRSFRRGARTMVTDGSTALLARAADACLTKVESLS